MNKYINEREFEVEKKITELCWLILAEPYNSNRYDEEINRLYIELKQ